MVTGAPGSEKSVVLENFLRLNSGPIAFDIDWFADSASGLAGRDVIFDVRIDTGVHSPEEVATMILAEPRARNSGRSASQRNFRREQ